MRLHYARFEITSFLRSFLSGKFGCRMRYFLPFGCGELEAARTQLSVESLSGADDVEVELPRLLPKAGGGVEPKFDFDIVAGLLELSRFKASQGSKDFQVPSSIMTNGYFRGQSQSACFLPALGGRTSSFVLTKFLLLA